jgi:type II secretory pathway component PulC
MPRFLLLTLALVFGVCTVVVAQAAQPRDQKVRADRQKIEAEGFWIYNDLTRGFAEAKKTGKPLLVVLRCIPCEECVKLDDDLVQQDPRIRPLLDKFVCVRVVSTNGLDLSLFQFDYDQSFAAFLLNADGAIYGRFGTRSHRTSWSGDVSVEGLAKALQGALELHEQYPANKDALARKRGPAPEYAAPEKMPGLKDKYTSNLNYEGNVAQSCIHCHQIGDAQRQVIRNRKEPLPEQVLFPYTHPKAIGLILDPKERATVRRVDKGTAAEQAGFQTGDVILTLERQPLLSVADVQWVLHQTSTGGAAVKAEVQRGGKNLDLTLRLDKGWRQRDDLSWRSSSWGLRRMAAGGLLLEELPAQERSQASIAEKNMALRVKHVGQYGPHAAAKNAGFRQGDVIISFDGRTDLRREADLLAHAVAKRMPGERVEVTVLREGTQVKLMLPMQE